MLLMFGDEVELWIIYFVNISTLERLVQFTFVITTSRCPLTCRGHLFLSYVTLCLLEVV
jgi:metal-sulfur cluster biosynthetic enzyme